MTPPGVSPLPEGKTRTVMSVEADNSGSLSKTVTHDADALDISVWADAVPGGDLLIKVYAQVNKDEPNKVKLVDTFPVITTPTSELVIRRSIPVMSQVRIEATWTGSATFEVRAKSLSTAVGRADGSIAFTASTAKDSPDVQNVTATDADTEYSVTLPANTVAFALRARSVSTRIQYAYVSGQSGTNYLTVPTGYQVVEEGLTPGSRTIYFQTSKASQVVEVLAWSN